jgi:hypothetical protein
VQRCRLPKRRIKPECACGAGFEIEVAEEIYPDYMGVSPLPAYAGESDYSSEFFRYG